MTELIWKRSTLYYSYLDEKAFFDWLESLDDVVGVEGKPEGLVITLKLETLSEEPLRDLLAIYKRYDGDMTELKQFLNPENESWFKNSSMYWYNDVFGSKD